jgi:hypothetical protein
VLVDARGRRAFGDIDEFAAIFAAAAVEERDCITRLQAQDLHVTHDIVGKGEGLAHAKRAVDMKAWHEYSIANVRSADSGDA